MRFFTREWYARLQSVATSVEMDSPSGDKTLAAMWVEAESQYLAAGAANLRMLPEELRFLVEHTRFHDGLLRTVVVDKTRIQLRILDRLVRARYTRDSLVTFDGVTISTGLPTAEGSIIIYTELTVDETGAYRYSALLTRGEFEIAFESARAEFLEITTPTTD